MITITSAPQRFTPAFNPVVFTLTTDNYLQPSFKFVADIYSDDGLLLATLKYQPQATGSDPVTFDISHILHELVSADYCKPNETVTPSIIIPAGGLVSGYSIQFGEQYNDVVYTNLVSYSGYIFNGAINSTRFAFYNYTSLVNTSFLTRFSRQIIRKSDSVICSILQGDNSSITELYLNIYNQSGNNLYTRTITNPYTSLSASNNRGLHLHVGFNYLYSLIGWSGDINNTASYYTITVPGGKTMRYDLYSQCERFPGTRLHFLNEMGGFDSFNFMLASKPSLTTERKNYQRQAANYGTAYDPINKRFETLARNYYTSYTERRTLISDYLTDTEADLLAELLTSPLVYMEEDASLYGGIGKVLIPISLTTLNYDIKRTRTDKLFNFELEVEITNSSKKQVI